VKNVQDIFQIGKLERLLLEYCRQQNWVVDQEFQTPQWAEETIDLVIRNGNEHQGVGVIIKDWKRAVGVDTIIRAERTMDSSLLLSGVLVVGNSFSSPAQALAEKINLPLLTRGELLQKLKVKGREKGLILRAADC